LPIGVAVYGNDLRLMNWHRTVAEIFAAPSGLFRDGMPRRDIMAIPRKRRLASPSACWPAVPPRPRSRRRYDEKLRAASVPTRAAIWSLPAVRISPGTIRVPYLLIISF